MKEEIIPMNTIIDEIIDKLKSEMQIFVSAKDYSIEAAEGYFVHRVNTAVTSMLGAYYEERDAEIRADKAGRKKAGLSVERVGDSREVLTQLGVVRFRRTYYKKASGGYEYPVDAEAGLQPYQRLSDGVSLALVENSTMMSYSDASELVTGGYVSRQSVMNKIRSSYVKQESVFRRNVPVLHIDADEDHVALQSGGSTIVPLISGYEGVRKRGKRGECVNIFHFSQYGSSSDRYWDSFFDELDRRYDLYGTKIYLHGDGAPWIKKGLDYLPNCTFVLDRYHVNSAMKKAVAGFDAESRGNYLKLLREAEIAGDRDFYESIVDSICMQGDEDNAEAAHYLLNNFDALHVYHSDPEASKGGATEPHVSHVLSSRLSSRPMGWSKKTLKHFAPILASGAVSLTPPDKEEEETFQSEYKHYLKPKKKRYLPNTLGLPDPDTAVFPRTRTGRRPYVLRLLT